MSNQLKKDANCSPTMVRSGCPVNGMLSLAQADNTANTWNRILPSGTAGAKVNNRELNLSTRRADVSLATFESWRIKILNEGYYQEIPIREMDGTNAHLEDPIQYYDSLPATVQWVVMPSPIKEFYVHLLAGSNDNHFWDPVTNVTLTSVLLPAASLTTP